MQDLVKELNRRYKITISKFSPDFIFELCNYLDLLVLDKELQRLLLDEQHNINHPQNIWEKYQELYKAVYEPLRIDKVNPKKHFSNFYWLNDDDRKSTGLSLVSLYCLPGVVAILRRKKYINWLNEIHPRILILLNNDKILSGSHVSYELSFDEEHSVINVMGYCVPIAKRKKETNEHKILRHIFSNLEQNNDGFTFQEIAEKEFNDRSFLYDPDSTKRYYSACEEIQTKVSKASKYQVPDFIEFHSGDRAWVRINPKYIAKSIS